MNSYRRACTSRLEPATSLQAQPRGDAGPADALRGRAATAGAARARRRAAGRGRGRAAGARAGGRALAGRARPGVRSRWRLGFCQEIL